MANRTLSSCIILRGNRDNVRDAHDRRLAVADATPLTRDEWIIANLDGTHFDWRADDRVLLSWRARFPLPEAGETRLTLNRLVFAAEDQAEAAA
jgi:hypothetical protein